MFSQNNTSKVLNVRRAVIENLHAKATHCIYYTKQERQTSRKVDIYENFMVIGINALEVSYLPACNTSQRCMYSDVCTYY